MLTDKLLGRISYLIGPIAGRRYGGSPCVREDRLVRREVYLYVDRGAASPDPEGLVECADLHHLCEPCAENRANAHDPVERVYPEPVESACADCGAHSFRPWVEDYDDAFTEERIIMGLLPEGERSREAGTVMYESICYPMVVCDGPNAESYRVRSDGELAAWADRRFSDWEIVAGRRRGWERYGVAHTPPSEAELIDYKKRAPNMVRAERRAESMKVRMILGEYEDQEPYGLDIFLSPLEFPMQVVRVGEADLDEIPEGESEDETYLYSEAQLREWADIRFATYLIWDMPVPEDAIREG